MGSPMGEPVPMFGLKSHAYAGAVNAAYEDAITIAAAILLNENLLFIY